MESNANEYNYSDEEDDDVVDNDIYIVRVYRMVVLSVVSLLGTVGNGLVIWFVVFKMKKTVTSVWFLSLALADFTFSLFQPLTVVHLALQGRWPFGGVLCKMTSLVVPLNMFSSILQLTVISIDRWACVVFHVWCRNHRSTRLAWMVALGVWVLTAVCCTPFFILRETDANIGGVNCGDTWSTFLYKENVILGFIIFFVVPLIIIVSCYTVIIVHMRKNRMVTSTKPFRMIAAIIISFVICWLPFNVYHIMGVSVIFPLNYYLYKAFVIGFPIAVSLAAINSCVNPFLYVFFGRDFKENIRGSIQSALRRAFTEEPDWRNPKRPTAKSAESRVSVIHDGEILPLYLPKPRSQQ